MLYFAIQALSMEVVLLIRLVRLAVLVLFITSCSEDVEPSFTLNDLYYADPTVDAHKAMAKGNLKVYGVYDYALTTPGIKRECVNKTDIIPIEGTSDAVQSYKESQFNTLARLYAEYYNRQVELFLISNGNDCFEQ